jgi:hypothetical protein
MTTTHLYRATKPNKYGRFCLCCVIDCVTRGRLRVVAPPDRRARSRVHRLSPPLDGGGGGTPGVARGRGKNIMHCATVQVFVKKGVKYG